MRRRRNGGSRVAALVGAALVLAVVVSCDQAGQSDAGPGKQSQSLLVWIPDGEYRFLGFADLEGIARSGFGRRVASFNRHIKLWDSKLGIGIERFHTLAWAVAFPEDLDGEFETLAILDGEVTEEEVLRLIGEKRRYFELEEVGDANLYFSGSDFGFAFIDENIVALGTTEMVRNSLAFHSGGGTSVLDGEGIRPFRPFLVATDDFWLGIDGIESMIGPLVDEYPLLQTFLTLRVGYIGVDAADDVTLRVKALCSSAEDALNIARGLRAIVGLLNMLIQSEDISRSVDSTGDVETLKRHLIQMLDSVQVEQDEMEISIVLIIPGDIADYFVDITREIVSRGDYGPDGEGGEHTDIESPRSEGPAGDGLPIP